ncbi:MAG: hypothetical protein WB683_17660 [Candidatus Sulfotelmatobacter sp.]
MSVRRVLSSAFSRQLPSLILCVLLLLSHVAAKTRASALDAGYVPALAAANHFLQAWQSGDVESGTALLSSHAKQAVTTDGVENFFSEHLPAAYEIERGKRLKRGRFEFPVVLVTETAGDTRVHRHFSSIIVVNTGNNDWAVDKLP